MTKFKEFIVTVEILKNDGKVNYARSFRIKAKDPGTAEAIVHNRLAFTEPEYRVTEVKEVEE